MIEVWHSFFHNTNHVDRRTRKSQKPTAMEIRDNTALLCAGLQQVHAHLVIS